MAINLDKKTSGGKMPYEAQISRSNPTAFLILIDQSASMNEEYPEGGTKADKLADVVNRCIANLIVRCTKPEGVRDYFDLGVIRYGGRGVGNALQGSLSEKALNPISLLEANAIRVEERRKKIDDGAGGFVEVATLFPVWVESFGSGGTPMLKGLSSAAEAIAAWCDEHPDSYPPTILHVTDGEANDGKPAAIEEIASHIRALSTNDGCALLFNLHLSSEPGIPLNFPSEESDAPNPYSRFLFRMSSPLPPQLLEYAKDLRFDPKPGSRGFIFQGKYEQIVNFFEIGTRAPTLQWP